MYEDVLRLVQVTLGLAGHEMGKHQRANGILKICVRTLAQKKNYSAHPKLYKNNSGAIQGLENRFGEEKREWTLGLCYSSPNRHKTHIGVTWGESGDPPIAGENQAHFLTGQLVPQFLCQCVIGTVTQCVS